MKYDKHHKPCDKVSHDCHIEYDNVSHNSIEIEFDEWLCTRCKYFEWDMNDDFVCHNSNNYKPERVEDNCKGFTKNNG